MAGRALPDGHSIGVARFFADGSVVMAGGMTFKDSTFRGVQFEGGELDMFPKRGMVRVVVRCADGRRGQFIYRRGRWYESAQGEGKLKELVWELQSMVLCWLLGLNQRWVVMGGVGALCVVGAFAFGLYFGRSGTQSTESEVAQEMTQQLGGEASGDATRKATPVVVEMDEVETERPVTAKTVPSQSDGVLGGVGSTQPGTKQEVAPQDRNDSGSEVKPVVEPTVAADKSQSETGEGDSESPGALEQMFGELGDAVGEMGTLAEGVGGVANDIRDQLETSRVRRRLSHKALDWSGTADEDRALQVARLMRLCYRSSGATYARAHTQALVMQPCVSVLRDVALERADVRSAVAMVADARENTALRIPGSYWKDDLSQFVPKGRAPLVISLEDSVDAHGEVKLDLTPLHDRPLVVVGTPKEFSESPIQTECEDIQNRLLKGEGTAADLFDLRNIYQRSMQLREKARELDASVQQVLAAVPEDVDIGDVRQQVEQWSRAGRGDDEAFQKLGGVKQATEDAAWLVATMNTMAPDVRWSWPAVDTTAFEKSTQPAASAADNKRQDGVQVADNASNYARAVEQLRDKSVSWESEDAKQRAVQAALQVGENYRATVLSYAWEMALAKRVLEHRELFGGDADVVYDRRKTLEDAVAWVGTGARFLEVPEGPFWEGGAKDSVVLLKSGGQNRCEVIAGKLERGEDTAADVFELVYWQEMTKRLSKKTASVRESMYKLEELAKDEKELYNVTSEGLLAVAAAIEKDMKPFLERGGLGDVTYPVEVFSSVLAPVMGEANWQNQEVLFDKEVAGPSGEKRQVR